MRKSWILIETIDGRQIKYANAFMKSGRSKPNEYYAYGDSAGDTFLMQGDTRGKVIMDYNWLVLSWTRVAATPAEALLIWPDSWPRPSYALPYVPNFGDSTILIRPDHSITQNYAFELQSKPFWGDTTITRQPALTYQRLSIHSIESISLIDQPFVGDTWRRY
jgi:hypothetical protein